jgi:hypothetical protein
MKPVKNKRVIFLTLCLITAMGLLIRLAYIANTKVDHPIRVDARQYLIYAYNLYNHNVFSKEYPTDNPSPDSFRSSGYPLFLSLFFYLDKKGNIYNIVYMQAVLSTLLIPLTFLIGIRIFPLKWAFIAACLVAFSPHLVSITSYILTETLFGLLLLTAVLMLCESFKKNTAFTYVGAGFFWGLSYFVNETALFLPYIISFFYIFHHFYHKKISKILIFNIILFLFVYSAFPVAWGIRNKVSLPSDAPKGSNRAIGSMSHGAYPGFFYKTESYRYFPYREDPMQPVFSSSLKNFTHIFWKRFKEKPLRYLSWYFFEKPYYLWSWNILQGQGDVYIYPVITSLYQVSKSANITREIMKFLHPVILVFSLFGIVLFVHRIFRGQTGLFPEYPVFILFILITYYTFLYTVFAPWPRYSIPLRPELYLWSLWSLKYLSAGIAKLYQIKNNNNSITD